MILRHPTLWHGGGLVLLAGLLCGCSSTLPVAETPPPPVSVSQPVVRDVVDYDDYEGRIAAVDTVEVRARVRGHLVKVNFEDGQMVEAGDPLFEIDPRPYKNSLDAAKALKLAADANLELAKKEHARTDHLARVGAASREDLDVAAAKKETAAAAVKKAVISIEQAQLDLDFTKVVAPLPGKISRTQVSVGNLVNAGGGETLLTTITSVNPMYVYFDVDERALLRYRRLYRKGTAPGGDDSDVPTALAAAGGGVAGSLPLLGFRPPIKDLNIPVYVGLEGEEGYPHRGLLDFAENQINASTGTIQVRGVLPNARRILDPGMRARVRIPVGDPRKAVLITERAVGSDQGRKFVYVVNAQNVAERRDVVLDRLSEGLQGVREGLSPEDWVVVNGIQRVRDGAKVEPRRIAMPGAPAGQNKRPER